MPKSLGVNNNLRAMCRESEEGTAGERIQLKDEAPNQ